MFPLIRTSVRFGLIAGTCVSLYIAILSKSGLIWEPIGQYLGYSAIVIMPICTFLAIRFFSRNYLNGKAVFKYSMITGLLVSFVAVVTYTGIKELEGLLFDDVYQERLLEETRKELESKGEGADIIEKRIEQIRAHYNSWKPYRNTFIWYMGLGLVYSAASHVIIVLTNQKQHQK